MQQIGLPLTQDLVLIGGGHAHALVLRMWGMDPMPGVRVTVINPGPVAPYTGMLPGHIAGHYRRDQMMIDLVPLARFAGARAVMGRVVGIDRAARRVLLASGQAIAYDLASVDIGIGSALPGVPGFAEHAVAAKPLGSYADRWQAFVAQAPATPRVVVVGGGLGGVELALASAHRLQAAGLHPAVTVLEQAAVALPGIGAGARAALLAHMQRLGVRLVLNAAPERIEAGAVVVNGQELPSDFTLAVAGTRPQGWLADTGLALRDGFLTVGPTLQTSDPAIFAVGDCADLAFAPRPKAGVFAVREAPYLFDNLRVVLAGRGALRRYRPQSDYLKLVSTGGKGAVADKFWLRLDGAWLWRWKNRIDLKFMEKFMDYPAMTPPPPAGPVALGVAQALGEKPLCGGCGAKVGADALTAALATLAAPTRPDVVSGTGDDAAVLLSGDGFQVISTDHLRAFTHDPALMARICATHALGDIWAMGAAPQVALAQITLPRMSPRMQAETLREIMAAASDVFRAAGADVVGGHTAIGAELTLGFTVTGLAPRIIGKGGARPGDALILTKPLGTGTILAAEMAGQRAPGLMLGEAVVAAFASMTRPLAADAAILAPVAHAMTDVTGFGLAGHLLEMLTASNCAAEVQLSAIPLLPGAEALAVVGAASSLAPANRVACTPRMTFTESPRAALLFDPQTAGGLLAAVPADQAAILLTALHAANIPATIIGHATLGAPFLTVTD